MCVLSAQGVSSRSATGLQISITGAPFQIFGELFEKKSAKQINPTSIDGKQNGVCGMPSVALLSGC